MARMQLSEEVLAPPSTVFDYVDQHENYREFFKGFFGFEWTCPRHKAGARLKLQGKSAWTTLPMEVETTAVMPEREISGIFVSGPRGHWEWLFQPMRGATKVTVIIDYDLPQELQLSVTDRSMMERALRSNMEKTLRALKGCIESKVPAAA